MVKREKWTEQEDLDLQTLVGNDSLETKWDIVAYKMEQLGYSKNPKQCRER